MAVVAADEADPERVDPDTLLLAQPLPEPTAECGPAHLAGGAGRRAGDLLERLGRHDLEVREGIVRRQRRRRLR